MELLIHAFGEPSPQQIHGGSVPLLKHRGTTPSSKTHTRTHTQDTATSKAKPLGHGQGTAPTRTARDKNIDSQAPPRVYSSISLKKISSCLNTWVATFLLTQVPRVKKNQIKDK